MAPLLRKPSVRLSPAIALLVGADLVQLRAGDETVFVLETEQPADLSRWLESLRNAHETPPQFPSLSNKFVTSLHQQLLHAGLLIDASNDQSPSARYWLSWPQTFRGGPAQPPRGSVQIISPDPIGETLTTVLTEHGFDARAAISPEYSPNPQDVARVVAWEAPHLSFVLAANQFAVQQQIPTLFVDLSHGRHATIGPFFVPKEGSCYACFRRRWREGSAARKEMELAEQQMVETRRSLPAFGCLPAFRYGAAAFAALEITAFVVGHRPLNTLNRALTIDWEGISTWLEPCWRFPWCEICGKTS